MQRLRSLRLVILVFLVSPLAGCISLDPTKMNPQPQPIAISTSAPVEIVPVNVNDGTIEVNVDGSRKDVDLNDYSAELAGLVAKSLDESGVTLAAGGRRVGLRVIWVDFMFQGPCIIDYTVTLGDDQPFGFQSQGESSNLETACRTAFETAARQILGDERTASYLGGS